MKNVAPAILFSLQHLFRPATDEEQSLPSSFRVSCCPPLVTFIPGVETRHTPEAPDYYTVNARRRGGRLMTRRKLAGLNGDNEHLEP